MKIKNITQIENFLNTVNSCKGNVYLTSQYGDRYNLKSLLSQYIGIAALLSEYGEELELWCDFKEDEQKFFKFFNENPEVI